MLDPALKAQLHAPFQRLTRPVEIVASLDDSPASQEMRALLEEMAELHERIHLRTDGQAARVPSFGIAPAGQAPRLHFAAVPLGHEFSSLVLALLQAGGVAPKVDEETLAQVRALGAHTGQRFELETFMSLSCHNCPDVVQALNLLALLNPRITHVAIDGGLFQQEVAARQVLAVPSVFLNGQALFSGRKELVEVLRLLDPDAAQRQARQAQAEAAREPWDLLVVGGGPAGAAAAVYAARKGIRTAVVAERFGGQTLDTLGIENYISVQQTTGPQFAAALERQARSVGVEILDGQRVIALEPAAEAGGLAGVRLEGGARLQARSVVLATGARWRQIGVPGEQTYRNRGVAYCPHCDGPLFKGQPVAVIGGGNSGVEAAIDLAGIASQVTLLEYADQLKADAVLVQRLHSLPNVRVITGAQTTELLGDGQRLSGLRWRARLAAADAPEQQIALAGVFVQIGLVPNTEWLRGVVALSAQGEILVDARGATDRPGIFAAGDATTVPFKQIVIAAGDGAQAALSAFDHLIRHAPVAPAVSAREQPLAA